MAEMTPIDIRIDEDAIKKQVETAVTEALVAASMKLRVAADSLNPGFLDWWHENQEQEIERRVAQALKAKEEQ